MIRSSSISLVSTHRLIPSRYSPEGTVLDDLGDGIDEVSAVVELDGATNSRLLGEAGLLPGIGIHELVFGVPYGEIINASFTHAAPSGGRFNDSLRGAWYAGVEFETAAHEVAYHRIRDLKEVSWKDEEVDTYDDYLADFAGDFHDLRGSAPENEHYLMREPIPACYEAPQRLAANLLAGGASGIVYPSVRITSGICVVCFRPALVFHVRRAKRLQFTFTASRAFSMSDILPLSNGL
jgi:RES domain-containing protein